MIFLLQFLIGGGLILWGFAIWKASRSPAWKKAIERLFLMEGDDLFAKKKSYSGYVQWSRYVALPAGLAMIFPTALGVDIIIGLAAAGLFWWMKTNKLAYDRAVRTMDRKIKK